jgi:DNA ligase D-like protein (predicted ligase)/DNA ligase D-like protein (predicted 3'-phosphoesterase)
LHQTTAQHPKLDQPDHLVFDLDPPEQMAFETIKGIAFDLRSFLRGYGYHPFVKTSGKKGLHLYCPIKRRWTHDDVRTTLKGLASEFSKMHSTRTTTNVRKEAREKKLFIDIARNGKSQTTACPYTLRATPEATVSMPLTWEQLEDVKSPGQFTIANTYNFVEAHGDPWEGFGSSASPLHDRDNKSNNNPDKSALADYFNKRNFNKTGEPLPGKTAYSDDVFVIHRHSASHLHYDLRLASEGVLRSWAVPKGMPGEPGIKHLAIETENHPMEYLDFEGTIPKGEYGAGKIWVLTTGSYHITKTKKEGFYFKLESALLDAEFRMHRMKGKEWLLERVDPAQTDISRAVIKPMLCQSSESVPTGLDIQYEVKWDGIRAMLYIHETGLIIRSRSGRDITAQFPEMTASRKHLKCTRAILDGEIVCLDAQGKPLFRNVISRMHKTGQRAIGLAVENNPAFFYLFDVIYLDGCHVRKAPLIKRRAWVADLIAPGASYRLSEALSDGDALFTATRKMGLEGIIAKMPRSEYYPGRRSDAWIKVKHRKTHLCRILGYTEGKGDRARTFGALHIGSAEDSNPLYLGKVGTGFTDKSLLEVNELVSNADVIGKPIEEKVENERSTTWIECAIPCEVEYASKTANGTLREPVFLRLRDDLSL